MEITEHVREVITADFAGSDIELNEDLKSHKVSGFLVWPGFAGKDQIDRQNELWEVLRAKLGPEAQQVSVIFTYTPREYKLLLAS